MVLIDPSHEDALFGIKGKLQRMRETSEGRTIPPVQKTITDADKELSGERKEEQVIDAIRQVVEAARHGGKLRESELHRD